MTDNSEAHGLKFKPVFILLSSTVLFTLFWYFGRTAFFNAHLRDYFPESDWSGAYGFFYFCVASVFFRTIIPILCIKFVLKDRIKNYGYTTKGASNQTWLYGLMLVGMIPLVYLASTMTSFQTAYPQCNGLIVDQSILWEHLLVFELIYGLLFLSGESFWRGYMIFGLEEDFGYYGILIMVIPYVMSHYEKPFLETMGAIVAGSVLGYLALKHRNFWLGVFVHWGVAMMMDFLALYQLNVKII